MRFRNPPLLDTATIQEWAVERRLHLAGTRKFEFILRAYAPRICPMMRDCYLGRDLTMVNFVGWRKDTWDGRVEAAWHLFGRGGELFDIGQIGRPAPRGIRPSRYLLHDYPLVLNDPVLEDVLSRLHVISRQTGLLGEPKRKPLPEHIELSSQDALAFDTARQIAAIYRWLICKHPYSMLREAKGDGTFEARELAHRFADSLDWEVRVAIGDIARPSDRRRSGCTTRDARIRQFITHMRSDDILGLSRQQAVDLVVKISEAFPGKFPLSPKAVETIVDRNIARA